MNLPVDHVLRQGIEAHEAGQIQTADRIYRSILQERPADPDAHFRLGLLAVEVGYPESSLPHFRRALEGKPDADPYWLALIDALNRSGQSDKAQALIEKRRELESMGGGAIRQLVEGLEPGETRLTLPDPTAAAPQEQLNRLIALLNQGNLSAVLELASALLERYPQDVVLHNILGGAYASQHRFDAAIECYDRALRINPDFAEAHYNRANALKETGDLPAAIESFQDAIRLRPVFAEAHNNLGLALQDAGDLTGAVKCFERAIAVAPDFAEAHNNLGNAKSAKGDLQGAIESFTSALAIAPGFAEAHNNLGNALKEKGEFAAAIASFEQAIGINPNYVEAFNNLGVAWQESGDPAAAIEKYRRALQLRPDFAEALINLGDSLRSIGDLPAAIDSFRRALQIKPDFAEAYANLGSTLKDSGDVKGAMENLERAIELRPDFPEAHYSLGRCCQVARRYDQALEHFRQTDYSDAKSFELDCLYLLDRKQEFLERNEELNRQREVSPLMGCLGCLAEVRYGLEIPNSFCSDPLAYIRNQPFDDGDGLIAALVAELPSLSHGMRGQPLLEQGAQTAGNIFVNDHPLLKRTLARIRAKIEDYRSFYSDSRESFLRHWPESYAIHGWLISMRSGGFLKSHIHESGWISGAVYLQMPGGLQGNEGAICFSTQGGVYPQDGKTYPERLVPVRQGDINLFPSSLFHHTLPFRSDQERISLAFDVIPL